MLCDFENDFLKKSSSGTVPVYPEINYKAWEAMDWIELAQNSGKWRAVVNTATNL